MTETQRANRRNPAPQMTAPGHEPSDVSPRGVLYAVLGLFVALGVSGTLLFGMFAVFDRAQERTAPPAIATADLVPPPPRLEAAPWESRAKIEAEAKARLEGYGWTDREVGIARIPIEDAMRVLATRGWPDPVERAQP